MTSLASELSIVKKYDITDCLKQNGTLIINTNYDEQILNEIMPQKMKLDINLKNISVYLIDADKIANENMERKTV